MPKNTRVILNISTHIDTTIDWTPSYSSKNYFYDEEGTLLDSFQIEAEMLNRYVADNQKGGVAYFMKAITMLSDQNNYTLKKQETDKKLLNMTAGPSQVGYIKAKDLFYAYYNVGFMQGTYNSLIRFVSEDKNYDVFVPYSLSTISYDEEKQQFICLLDESSNEVLGGTFESYMLYFDQERQQFAGGAGSQSIPYFSENTVTELRHPYRVSTHAVLVKNGIAYMISEYPSEQYFERANPEADVYEFDVRLLLIKINLETQAVTHTVIKNDFPRAENNAGYLAGSTDLPGTVENNTLYQFTSDDTVFIVQDEYTVTELKMPYIFADTLSLKRPRNTARGAESFFDSHISIDDDGVIYILNLFRDGMFRVHALSEVGTYQLVWEAKAPSIFPKKTFISSFELIEP